MSTQEYKMLIASDISSRDGFGLDKGGHYKYRIWVYG